MDFNGKFVEMVFCQADLESKGYLSPFDLKIAFIMVFGYKPSKIEIQELFDFKNEPKGLTPVKFQEIIRARLKLHDPDDTTRQQFLAMDKHCKGFLKKLDFHFAVSHFAPNIQQHTVDSAFREIDRDGDGRVSYRDFEFMMKYNI